jgi:hypothetical protein
MHLVGIIYLKSHYVPIHHIVESFRVSDSMSVVSYVCFSRHLNEWGAVIFLVGISLNLLIFCFFSMEY